MFKRFLQSLRNRILPATKSFQLEIPLKNGKGRDSIQQATLGTTLNGTISITHDLQRIDTLPTDPPEEWTVRLIVNGVEITKREHVKNGKVITQEGIKTKVLGKTEFAVEIEFSYPFDLTAHIDLAINY